MKPIDPQRIEVLDPLVVQILRTKTPAEKIVQAVEASFAVRTILRHTIRQAHPTWDESQISAEITRRVLHESD